MVVIPRDVQCWNFPSAITHLQPLSRTFLPSAARTTTSSTSRSPLFQIFGQSNFFFYIFCCRSLTFYGVRILRLRRFLRLSPIIPWPSSPTPVRSVFARIIRNWVGIGVFFARSSYEFFSLVAWPLNDPWKVQGFEAQALLSCESSLFSFVLYVLLCGLTLRLPVPSTIILIKRRTTTNTLQHPSQMIYSIYRYASTLGARRSRKARKAAFEAVDLCLKERGGGIKRRFGNLKWVVVL